MELMDKEDFLDLVYVMCMGQDEEFIKAIKQVVEDTPVIDAEPVNHAHWVTRVVNGGYMHTICSHCGAEIADSYANAHPNLYCDNCGYKMDEV